MKTWITTEVFTHADQKVLIQPTPEFDGIEVYFGGAEKTIKTEPLYINREELPTLIEKLTEMMNYVIK